jgi:hypothetical protein
MNHPKGQGWLVREYSEAGTGKPILGVFSTADNNLSENGCRLVVQQAAKGNAEAIAAILICTEDIELQRILEESK